MFTPLPLGTVYIAGEISPSVLLSCGIRAGRSEITRHKIIRRCYDLVADVTKLPPHQAKRVGADAAEVLGPLGELVTQELGSLSGAVSGAMSEVLGAARQAVEAEGAPNGTRALGTTGSRTSTGRASTGATHRPASRKACPSPRPRVPVIRVRPERPRPTRRARSRSSSTARCCSAVSTAASTRARPRSAVAAAKRAVYFGGSMKLKNGLRLERVEFLHILPTPHAQELMLAHEASTGAHHELPLYRPEIYAAALESGCLPTTPY